MENKGFSEKSRGKIKKLSTGGKSCSPLHGEILFTPNKQSIYKKNQKDARDRLHTREKSESQFATHNVVADPAAAVRTAHFPFLPVWVRRKRNNRTAAAGHVRWKHALQKAVAANSATV